MGLSFRVYGTLELTPTLDELIEILEEGEFDATIESDGEDEVDWSEFLIFEASLDEPISLYCIDDEDGINDDLDHILSRLMHNGNQEDAKELIHILQNTVSIYGVDVPEEHEDDDNALLLCSLLVQYLAQKTDGIYCVDAEGFFNDSGDLIYEVVQEE